MEQPQAQKQPLKNIVVTMIITPTGEGSQTSLETQTAVSVNGRPVANIQAALVLAGDISVGLTSGVENIGHLRTLGQCTQALATDLQEKMFDHVLSALAPKTPESNGEAPQQDAPQD